MDKKLFRKWFNGKYGKLPPERQLNEIAKLRVILDDFEESRHKKFGRYHEKCACCGKYSLRRDFVKDVSLETHEVEVASEKMDARFSVERYTCPKCGKTFIYDQIFVDYDDK